MHWVLQMELPMVSEAVARLKPELERRKILARADEVSKLFEAIDIKQKLCVDGAEAFGIKQKRD